MNNNEVIQKIEFIYNEYEKMYINILKKNNIQVDERKVTLLDCNEMMKENFSENINIFDRVIYLFFDSDDPKIDILDELMEIYSKIKETYSKK